MNRIQRNNYVHNAPGAMRVALSIRGVAITENIRGRFNSLCKLDWNPKRYDSLPPHGMWARVLGVEPSRLTAKFMHRPGRLNIILDVAKTDDV